MDDVDGLRLKLSSEDSVSLASSLAEPINLEDSHYAWLRGVLETDAQNLEAESWSVAVEQSYLKALTKEAVKRQDVIYELIQTEMHHVRTIKILLHVYMHELKQSQLIEETRLQQLFPKVDTLLFYHQHFLNRLKVRQSQCQEEDSPNGYQITQVGDILISQFSDAVGEGMKECYGHFCQHQNEAVSFYKEQLQTNKKLQILIRKLGQLSLVRRLGIPECFLLVTQRITKYPVLVERIIANTEADTEEHTSLVEALGRIKDTISQVNTQVSDYEKVGRLREIGMHLDPKSQGRQKDGQLFRREDLIQGNKTMLHEGPVTWKSSGRQKDIHAVLLSDALLLLQDKDQRLVFAAMENKPPVISLRGLIVREVAHEDKAMFLICACATSLPQMYEIHTGSREERITWTTLIQEAVEHYPQEEQQRALISKLQHYEDALRERDFQILQCLTEKQRIFAAFYSSVLEQETPHRGLLLRGDASDLQQGGVLLQGAMDEVKNLLSLLFSKIRHPNLLMEESRELWMGETLGDDDSDSSANAVKNGHVAERPASPECLEESADEETLPGPNCYSASSHFPEMNDRLMNLSRTLHSLKAVIAQQDSQIELQRAFQSNSQQPSRHYNNVLLEQEKQRNLERQRDELAHLHKLQAQHQEKQLRWEKEMEQQKKQIEALEAQVQQREDECRKWEERLNEERAELEMQRGDYQRDLERLRESTKSVEKEKERLGQWEEKLKSKSKHISCTGHANYDDSTQHWNLSSYPSFRGSMMNGAIQVFAPNLTNSNLMEIPPKVPPRKESISLQPAKPELPIHLISTTNQVYKPPVVQQQIPTKLATLAKGKEKGFRTKGSHQRTHSAASIDVNQVLPIRVTGKEGGSLRAKRNQSPQRIYQSDIFKPPGSALNVKSSQSFSTHKLSSSSSEAPPAPPPFPKEILEKGKEKVIFL
ncbi:rho guanine nucleotide exchange factor 18a [Echeneis naucrates]|uniref:Rho guanine nucleotide exchange factor 18-like n=1 Tax=Echeneis naucrates TaxID=173247 RepID=A0A665TNJ5_ECHNA|nr:rho guanine nucleotide exchange factor 18-like [Echeneis naucrates]XP_029379988.1 rho guanine nucleotide exchange factor 18-like [Echeneis naucrates]XP_029379989.1 rho guanine nucleotide exchange factor 18-like [Echeneis naucrates]XP_029379990.1 rho guanine nucleotide exchange factor 18-like [Echeneis naucrates]XP_029379991.1 rho guanine nucleotide exchange factor 18-like [Echeneis naucrates]XP_029379992.1 rho guanine nucleotide exchange factor 18-like [Echeneis naucrates]XP_029379993.1 rh